MFVFMFMFMFMFMFVFMFMFMLSHAIPCAKHPLEISPFLLFHCFMCFTFFFSDSFV